MKNGVIYARFSSHNQKDESIEQQVDECTEFAQANNIQIIEVYADKAVSGRTDKRAAFQRMMKDAERHKFEVIIAYKSNRIARNMLNALQYEEKLSKLGIETFYAKEEYGNTPSGRFALRMMMSMNQFYSENLAEDIKRGMKDNAQKGKVNGSIPFGYKKGEDGKFAIDEEKAALVREIYRRTKDGEKFADIAEDLNSRGIKTRYGNDWNKGSFHRMLTSEIYTGVYKHSGIRIENAVPVIISKEEFEEMQELLHTKTNPIGRKRDSMEYLLTGKLFCGLCGSPMVGISATSHTGDKHFYYTCKGRQNHTCTKESVRKEYIEEEVCRITKEEFLTDEVIKLVAEAFVKLQEEAAEQSDLPFLREELKKAEKGIKNLTRALQDGYSYSIAEEIKRLERDVEGFKRQIRKEEERHTVTEGEVIFVLTDFRNGNLDDPKYRKWIIGSFIEKVVLWDDEIEIDYYPTGKDGVRIRSNRGHHTLTIRTFMVTVSTESLSIKGKLPSR